MTSSWEEATRGQYDDDRNLAARQATFDYLIETSPMPAPLGDWSTVADKTVVDVGCGNGLFLNQAADAAALAIGTDLSMGMIEICKRAMPSVPLFRANAERLPLADDSADVTLALWMLYHVDNKAAAVAELRRVTRAGGQAVVATNSGRETFFAALVKEALGEVCGRPVERWVHELSFNAENGTELLGETFDFVEVHESGSHFRFTDTEVVVAYVGSMLGPIHALNGPFDDQALLTAVGRRVEASIANEGGVEMSRRRAVFICR